MCAQKDRRLGTRHVLGPVAVRWRLDIGPLSEDVPPPDGGSERAGLLDLSVSGARIMARTNPDVAVGDWTMVSIRGHSGPVIVRRILSSRQEGFSQYGLEFLDPMSPLTQLVHEELARRGAAHAAHAGAAPTDTAASPTAGTTATTTPAASTTPTATGPDGPPSGPTPPVAGTPPTTPPGPDGPTAGDTP